MLRAKDDRLSDGALYRLTFRPLPGDVPPAARLRAVLKRLLRSHGFRAVAVEEAKPTARRDTDGGGYPERPMPPGVGR
jgi:hypothetical protein